MFALVMLLFVCAILFLPIYFIGRWQSSKFAAAVAYLAPHPGDLVFGGKVGGNLPGILSQAADWMIWIPFYGIMVAEVQGVRFSPRERRFYVAAGILKLFEVELKDIQSWQSVATRYWNRQLSQWVTRYDLNVTTRDASYRLPCPNDGELLRLTTLLESEVNRIQ